MSSKHPPLPPPPQPTKILFDPFHSSATGHQMHASRLAGSTSWKESRGYKLAHQLADSSGRGGGQHLADLVGAGSKDFGRDGRKENGDWEKGAPGLREKGWQDIRGLMDGSKKRKHHDMESSSKLMERPTPQMQMNALLQSKATAAKSNKGTDESTLTTSTFHCTSDSAIQDVSSHCQPGPPQIFKTLNLYLNGSTAPLVSDHRLKQLWVQHGGSVSIGLGRKTVTHVVLGNADSGGGGLASSKIQKEISTVRGKGVKFVKAEWVLDCVKKGKKLSEANYVAADKIGGARQKSVRDGRAAARQDIRDAQRRQHDYCKDDQKET